MILTGVYVCHGYRWPIEFIWNESKVNEWTNEKNHSDDFVLWSEISFVLIVFFSPFRTQIQSQCIRRLSLYSYSQFSILCCIFLAFSRSLCFQRVCNAHTRIKMKGNRFGLYKLVDFQDIVSCVASLCNVRAHCALSSLLPFTGPLIRIKPSTKNAQHTMQKKKKSTNTHRRQSAELTEWIVNVCVCVCLRRREETSRLGKKFRSATFVRLSFYESKHSPMLATRLHTPWYQWRASGTHISSSPCVAHDLHLL